jgi:hypothetical protein
MTYSEAGKGSRQRPGKGYAAGWDAIYGKKPWYVRLLNWARSLL